MKGIPRPISIKKIISLQLKEWFGKRCQLYVAHVKDPKNDKVPSLMEFLVLQYFIDMFKVLILPLKRDIDFSIDLVLGATPVS